MGGPVLIPKLYNGRNRTFFYFVWEGLRERSPRTNTLAVPTAAQREGNFAGLPAIRDPFTGLPFPNNQIPRDRLSSASQELVKFYPIPNLPGSGAAGAGFNYSTNLSNQPELDNWSIRSQFLRSRSRLRPIHFLHERAVLSGRSGDRVFQ